MQYYFKKFNIKGKVAYDPVLNFIRAFNGGNIKPNCIIIAQTNRVRLFITLSVTQNAIVNNMITWLKNRNNSFNFARCK